MTWANISLLFLLASVHALGQTATDFSPNVVGERGSLRVSPLYQRWSYNALSQASTLLTWSHPIVRDASVSLRCAYGTANGDVTSLNGLTDIHLTGTYYLEDADLVFSLGVGIPSGTKKLTFSQFQTSVLLSSNTFRAQIPNFGTGLNISPSIVWAFPASENVVLGLGAMFQYRGEFLPLDDPDKYDPGDEFSLTSGVDFALDQSSSISGDVVFSLYGNDTFGGLEIFRPGVKVLASMQYHKYFEMDLFHILFTYRSKAKAEFAPGNLIFPIRERIEPNQAELVGTYTAHFSKQFAMQFMIEGRFFQATATPLTGFDLVGIGLMPEFKLSETLSLPLRFKYVYGWSARDGKLSGAEAGLGIAVSY